MSQWWMDSPVEVYVSPGGPYGVQVRFIGANGQVIAANLHTAQAKKLRRGLNGWLREFPTATDPNGLSTRSLHADKEGE